MNEPRVTVIIPAYQSSRLIARPLDSLLAQTRPADEILVVDDGSSDDLAQALAPYATRVNLIRKPNGGAASARNLGIDRAGGNLIAFLDADDYWEPTKLERQLNILRDHPQVGLVGCRWFEEPPGESRRVTQSHDLRFYDRPIAASGKEAFYVAMCMWTSTLLIRREVLADHRFVSGLEPAEDRELWLQLVPSTTVYLLSEPLATYVLEPNSLSRGNVDRDCGNMLRVIHRHAAMLGNDLRLEEAMVYRRWAAGHLSRGQAAAARTPAWNRLARQPLSMQAWWILFKSLTASLAFQRPNGARH